MTMKKTIMVVAVALKTPLGERGVSGSAGTGFWQEDYARHGLPALFETANRETMLIPQCESLGCLEHLEEIVAMPGIDGIFVGPFDLSTAMGIPGQFEHPDFLAALRRIRAVCRAAGKPTLIYAADPESARADLAMGYDSITYSMDAGLLIEAGKAAIRALLT